MRGEQQRFSLRVCVCLETLDETQSRLVLSLGLCTFGQRDMLRSIPDEHLSGYLSSYLGDLRRRRNYLGAGSLQENRKSRDRSIDWLNQFDTRD